MIPPAAEIEAMSVTRWKPNGKYHTEFKIYDRQRIEAVLAELRSNNAGYSSALEGQTPQEYSIGINTRETMVTMVWIGPDWLGGVDEQHTDERGTLASHYRKLDEEQHTRLLILLRQPE